MKTVGLVEANQQFFEGSHHPKIAAAMINDQSSLISFAGNETNGAKNWSENVVVFIIFFHFAA